MWNRAAFLKLTFSREEPQMSGNQVLRTLVVFLFLSPLVAGAATFNVRDYGATGDKTTPDTKAIQAAIDACSKAGGGTVCFPSGDYLSGMIRLKSHITLHLENGATLWASPDRAEYEMVDVGRLEDGNPYLLVADKAEYVSITGAGAIHGQGTADWNRRRDAPRDWSPEFFKWRIAVMLLKDCRHVAINGITILYSQTWTIHLLGCEKIFVDGITIENNYYRSTTDGIDVHSCRDVHISNCNITAGDDCICLKTLDGRPCENVVVNNCTLESVATAIKLGTGSNGDFRDIHVSNCTVRNSTVGIGLYIKDGGTAERVTFANISVGTIENASQVNEGLQRATYPIFVDIEKRTEDSPIGAIRDLAFHGIHIHSDNGSLIQGMRESPIENLTLSNITTRIERPFDYSERRKHGGGSSNPKDDRRTLYAQKPSYFTLAHVDGLVADNLRVLVADEVFAEHPRSALCINETVDGLVRGLHRTPRGIPDGEPVLSMHNCRRMFVTSCFASPGTPAFLGLSGKDTSGISLAGNDLNGATQPIFRSDEVPVHAVRNVAEPLVALPGQAVKPGDVQECLAHYDRRFAQAMAALPRREPWLEEDRAEIARIARSCLGIRDAWRPRIRTKTVRVTEHDGFSIEHLRGTSWPEVICTAHLYVPTGAKDGALPLGLLCCGHGRGCKLNPGYQAMARHLARCGMLVLVFDNIGQGEREPMGHAHPVVPFACGTTVEGLIALEALGWLEWAKDDARVDGNRMAAVGNSGGGKLAIFLAALCPGLAALSSSGWPSTFEFVARKEKRLCHCTLLPGTVGRIEVWHLLGCFAPRPLLIFQGKLDRLFPEDLFHRVARQVKGCYDEVGAGDRFAAVVVPGEHSWDGQRRELLGRWLSGVFDLGPTPPVPDEEDGNRSPVGVLMFWLVWTRN